MLKAIFIFSVPLKILMMMVVNKLNSIIITFDQFYIRITNKLEVKMINNDLKKITWILTKADEKSLEYEIKVHLIHWSPSMNHLWLGSILVELIDWSNGSDGNEQVKRWLYLPVRTNGGIDAGEEEASGLTDVVLVEDLRVAVLSVGTGYPHPLD